MVLGYTLEEMLKVLRHNGLMKVCDEPEPYCFRGFHPAEFVSVCLTRGLSMTMIEKYPAMMHGSTLVDHTPFLGCNRFYLSFDYGSGVILGESAVSTSKVVGHAVAWDINSKLILDPRGMTWTLADMHAMGFNPRQFFLIQSVNPHEGRPSL